MCKLTDETKKQYYQNPQWAIMQLDQCLQNMPYDVDLLIFKAEILEAIDKIPDAINLLNKVLKLADNKQEIQAKIELLKTILRYRNLDIYGNTNTWHDPWLD